MSRLQIVRTDAGYHARILGGNGEPVSASEVLSSKRRAETNLVAQAKVFYPSPRIERDTDGVKVIRDQLIPGLVAHFEQVDERGLAE